MSDRLKTIDYDLLVRVLIYHQRTVRPPYAGACTCGWGTRPEHLGLLWPEHIVDVYEEAAAPAGGGSDG